LLYPILFSVWILVVGSWGFFCFHGLSLDVQR
jgi:hypothetical protein